MGNIRKGSKVKLVLNDYGSVKTEYDYELSKEVCRDSEYKLATTLGITKEAGFVVGTVVKIVGTNNALVAYTDRDGFEGHLAFYTKQLELEGPQDEVINDYSVF